METSLHKKTLTYWFSPLLLVDVWLYMILRWSFRLMTKSQPLHASLKFLQFHWLWRKKVSPSDVVDKRLGVKYLEWYCLQTFHEDWIFSFLFVQGYTFFRSRHILAYHRPCIQFIFGVLVRFPAMKAVWKNFLFSKHNFELIWFSGPFWHFFLWNAYRSWFVGFFV